MARRNPFRLAAAAFALAGLVVCATGLIAGPAATRAGAAVTGLNPVREPTIDGHAANSGFLVFVQNDLSLSSDDSEGTIAVGGNLTWNTAFPIASHVGVFPTFTVAGDAQPTGLYVGGQADWAGSAGVLTVQNSQYTKILSPGSFLAHPVTPYRITAPAASQDALPAIHGVVAQPPARSATCRTGTSIWRRRSRPMPRQRAIWAPATRQCRSAVIR